MFGGLGDVGVLEQLLEQDADDDINQHDRRDQDVTTKEEVAGSGRVAKVDRPCNRLSPALAGEDLWVSGGVSWIVVRQKLELGGWVG